MTTAVRRFLTVLALGGAMLGSARGAAPYVWLKGEQPTHANVPVAGKGWGNVEYLSGGKWLDIDISAENVEKQVPAGGIVLDYDFQAPVASHYEVWNRIGFEFVRSAFDWRLDDGAWQTIEPTQLTTDLEPIATWNEVAWLKMGEDRKSVV